MKILLAGAAGMLGRELAEYLPTQGHEVICSDIGELDITNAAACINYLQQVRPQVLINCAAMTAVDNCEMEKEKAFLLNATGTGNLAAACNKSGATMVHISTDYVFSGEQEDPYCETDQPAPQTVYGQSKLAGELEVQKICPDFIIARIAWLYGRGGPSFLHTMLKLAQAGHPQLKVVNDQRGNPTSCRSVAIGLNKLLNANCRGLFHLTCEGETTWHDFTAEIFRQAGIKQEIVPCSSEEFPRPAKRPHNSSLANANLASHNLPPQPHWQEALNEFFISSGEDLI